MICIPILAIIAQPILRNFAQNWLFLTSEHILMKMKTQVDMINLNHKIFSFNDLVSNYGQFCAANLAQYCANLAIC